MTTKVRTMAKVAENRSSRHWRATLADLAQQRTEAAERLDKLARTKRPLRAFMGDGEARAELDQLNASIRTIEQELGDLDAAVAEAEAELAAAERAERGAREVERLTELRRRAETRAGVAGEVEAKMRELAEVLARYDAAGGAALLGEVLAEIEHRAGGKRGAELRRLLAGERLPMR